MLPPEHRMRRSTEFAMAVRHGRRRGSSTVVAHLAVLDDGDPPRVGFVVNRAVGGAVVRNRVRRRLRHLMRERLRGLAPGSLLVIRALPAAATAPASTVRKDLDLVLETVIRRSRVASS